MVGIHLVSKNIKIISIHYHINIELTNFKHATTQIHVYLGL
jgi:hypothetical protein